MNLVSADVVVKISIQSLGKFSEINMLFSPYLFIAQSPCQPTHNTVATSWNSSHLFNEKYTYINFCPSRSTHNEKNILIIKLRTQDIIIFNTFFSSFCIFNAREVILENYSSFIFKSHLWLQTRIFSLTSQRTPKQMNVKSELYELNVIFVFSL